MMLAVTAPSASTELITDQRRSTPVEISITRVVDLSSPVKSVVMVIDGWLGTSILLACTLTKKTSLRGFGERFHVRSGVSPDDDVFPLKPRRLILSVIATESMQRSLAKIITYPRCKLPTPACLHEVSSGGHSLWRRARRRQGYFGEPPRKEFYNGLWTFGAREINVIARLLERVCVRKKPRQSHS